MSSYVKKTIKCPCCGKKYVVELLKGYSTCMDVDLDTNPHNSALYDRVVLCPACGFATSKPYTAITEDLKAAVKSTVYTEMLKNRQFDNTGKKLLLAGYLAVKDKNAKEAGYNYLLAYWYLKETNSSNADKACEKAIKNFERYLKYNYDEEIAMILIDCLRQMKRFDEAIETANSLEPYISNDKMKAILLFEKKLISNNDSGIYRVSEVGL